jgi:hypothetical protein
MVEKVLVPSAVDLPLARGRRVGQIRLYQGGKLLGARPLVAARSVSRPGFAGRIGWYIGRTFHHFFGFFT